MPQKPPQNPWVDIPAPKQEWIDVPAPEPQQSLWKKAWGAITQPKFDVRGPQTEWQTPEAQEWLKQHPKLKTAGDIGNVGLDLVSGSSSLLNMGFLGLGVGEFAAAEKGLPALTKALTTTRRVASAPLAVEGGQNVWEGIKRRDPIQGTVGGIEALFGGLGAVLPGPAIKPQPIPKARRLQAPTRRFEAGPEGIIDLNQVQPQPIVSIPPPKVAAKPADITPPGKVTLPEGWAEVIGETPKDVRGKPMEGKVDYAKKQIIYADEKQMKSPDVSTHERVHVKIENLPVEVKKQLRSEYVKLKINTPEWQGYGTRKVNKPGFQNEAIAMDITDYYNKPESLDPQVKALFDRVLTGIGETPVEAKPLIPPPAPKDYIRQQLARTDELAREEMAAQQPIPEIRPPGELDARVSGVTPEAERPQLVKPGASVKSLADMQKLFKEEGASVETSKGTVGMGIPKGEAAERAVIQSYRGTIAKATAHVGGKELVQNAIDATAEVPDGKVKITHSDDSQLRYIQVEDNGLGIPLPELKTTYLDLTASGKRGGPVKTIGEMGVGKVAYLTKGEKFEFKTIVRGTGSNSNHKFEHTFASTPEQVLNKQVTIKTREVPQETPTGTTVRLTVPPGDDFWGWNTFIRELGKYSDLPIPVEITKTFWGPSLKKEIPHTPEIISAKPTKTGRIIGEGETEGSNYRVSIPEDAIEVEAEKIKMVLVNRGMFQGVEEMYVGKEMRVPEKIVVELDPKVAGDHELYPLSTPTRESMKYGDPTRNAVTEVVKKEIIEGATKAREDRLGRMFDALVPKAGEPYAFVDPYGRMTPDEIKMFTTSPTLTNIIQSVKAELDELVSLMGQRMPGEIKMVGYIIEKGIRGINVRNPKGQNQFGIFLDPVALLKNYTPRQAASGIVHVTKHEFAHTIERSEGADFTATLADVDTFFELERQIPFKQAIQRALEGENASGIHNPEIQELLLKGEEIRGRTGTDRAVLIREEGSRLPSNEGQGRTPIGSRPIREGTAREKLGEALRNAIPQIDEQLGIYRQERAAKFARAKEVKGEGEEWAKKFTRSMKGKHTRIQPGPVEISQVDADALFNVIRDYGQDVPLRLHANSGLWKILEGDVVIQESERRALKTVFPEYSDLFDAYHGPLESFGPPKVDIKKKGKTKLESFVSEAVNLPRALMSSFDLSFPFRQGIGLIHTKAWWTSWNDMVRSFGSEKTFRGVMDGIMERPNFRSFRDPTGRVQKSLAQRAKLAITDLTELSKREEERMSTWAESGGNIPLLSPIYGHTLGRVVRGSNRAYVAFANKLRADNFDLLIKQAEKAGLNPRFNDPLLKQIGSFINNASGRGNLGAFERGAVVLNGLMFSPRLMASRLQMLNPANYIKGPNFVRKQYLKSLTALASAWWGMAMLAKWGGADVSTDPTNADFGKIRIGDTRIDPAGGFQQYLVLAYRLGAGRYTSSTTGKTREFGARFGDKTRRDAVVDFAINKAAPIPGYVSDWASQTKYRPFDVQDQTMRLFVPMLLQDFSEIMQEDPDLLPTLIPGAVGMSVQTYEKGRGKDMKLIPPDLEMPKSRGASPFR